MAFFFFWDFFGEKGRDGSREWECGREGGGEQGLGLGVQGKTGNAAAFCNVFIFFLLRE